MSGALRVASSRARVVVQSGGGVKAVVWTGRTMVGVEVVVIVEVMPVEESTLQELPRRTCFPGLFCCQVVVGAEES